jgi:peptide methionine sulfoxide reductase MsrA
VFYVNEEQKRIVEKLIDALEDEGYSIATELSMADSFWIAEEYHQDYYSRTGKKPYCHSRTERF